MLVYRMTLKFYIYSPQYTLVPSIQFILKFSKIISFRNMKNIKVMARLNAGITKLKTYLKLKTEMKEKKKRNLND